MPLNNPRLDSRGYNELVSVVVLVLAAALTLAYPDSIPFASYFVMSGTSAARDSTIPLVRAAVNGVVWGTIAYTLLRVSERLRHKGR
ncbi:MAG: hypothetical protein ACFFEV_01890 [Candidatus Thorarchaeota archaeon]